MQEKRSEAQKREDKKRFRSPPEPQGQKLKIKRTNQILIHNNNTNIAQFFSK